MIFIISSCKPICPQPYRVKLSLSSKTMCCTNVLKKIRSDQSLSRVRLLATPWIAARQASLSITNSRSSLRFTSIESVMPSSHLTLCRPLLLLPPIPPSIRIFFWLNTRIKTKKHCLLTECYTEMFPKFTIR